MLNIFNLTEKLQQCNTYIARLEAQNDALRQQAELAQKAHTADSASRYEQRKEAFLRPIREMTAYVDQTYEFRHNVVRDSYEMRRRADGGPWFPVDDRQLNTIMNQVQDEGHVYCLKSLVTQRIRSAMALDYHPVADYLAQVRGTWDGNDRLDELACRVSTGDYCRRLLPVWLRAMVAQWLSLDTIHANAVMLLLISPQQGLQKSTFLHQLLPEALEQYYTDDFALTTKGNAERKLVEFAIINIDEFDKLPVKKLPDLKTLMQTLRPSFVKAYKTNFNQLPRIASFVGTSNERHVLTDRTGSRRFLIIEPDGPIDVDGIDHDQLYAQLIHEVETGARYWFTKDEEAEMQLANQPYYRLTPLEKLFRQFFRRPENADEEYQSLSAAQIMEMLRRHAPSLLRQESVTSFGRMLTRLAIPRDHQHLGNAYRVVAL
jgi:predicted P-loop ATPase